MENDERKMIKKYLVEISKLEKPLTLEDYSYFRDNIDEVYFDDKELVRMTNALLFGKFYFKEDLELKVVELILNKMKNKNQPRLLKLLYYAYIYDCFDIVRFLLGMGIPVTNDLLGKVENFLKKIKLKSVCYITNELVEYDNVLNLFKLKNRELKVLKIKANIRLN